MALKDILLGRLGFGAAPLGNMFRDIPEQEAVATVNAAWDDGIRYFDTAPFYGAGLAEIRIGAALAGRPRRDYVVSTKVGRLILDEVEDVSARDLGEKGGVFKHGRPNRIVNDYSRDGTLRSIEGSLKGWARTMSISSSCMTSRRISTETSGFRSSKAPARAPSRRSTGCATRA
jgi:D-threo-aldose 1-dehydrogenase